MIPKGGETRARVQENKAGVRSDAKAVGDPGLVEGTAAAKQNQAAANGPAATDAAATKALKKDGRAPGAR